MARESEGDIFASDLDGLTSLVAEDAGISDLTGLEFVTALESLRLFGNLISDLTPLQGLTGLTLLLLSSNSISDVQALVDNEGLGSGDEVRLRFNPLSQQALCEQIPLLQARGVTVLFDGACEP
jgi:hypothetical protein